MNLAQIAKTPAVVAPAFTSVLKAIEIMSANDVGAIVVIDTDNRVKGIFTERDNMLKVTLAHKDPAHTPLSDVMSSPVQTASPDMSPEDALQRMAENRFRHLPMVDGNGKILGMVSVRELLLKRLSEQQDDIETLSAYVEAGGPG